MAQIQKTCCLQIKIKIETNKVKYTMKHMSQTNKAKAIAWKLEKVSHKVIAPSLPQISGSTTGPVKEADRRIYSREKKELVETFMSTQM